METSRLPRFFRYRVSSRRTPVSLILFNLYSPVIDTYCTVPDASVTSRVPVITKPV